MNRARGQNPVGRDGFTLVELAATVMIVGILAGLALPALTHAIRKADAAHMVSDARTVQLAAYGYLGDHGVFPPGGGMGTAPAALAEHLPENFEFSYKDVDYMWLSVTIPGITMLWQTRTLGIFVLNFSSRPDLADAMRSYAGPDAFWTPTLFYFIYSG